MAMYGGVRDISLVNRLNRELLGDIINQQASFYKFKLEETTTNIYGEASGGKFYDGPFIFNCLLSREAQKFPIEEIGVNFKQTIDFYFFRQDLVDAGIFPEVGDIILYNEGYYTVDTATHNQYWLGKDPDYPNKDNPLNPDLELWGSNISILCSTHYTPSDKVSISPYKERS